MDNHKSKSILRINDSVVPSLLESVSFIGRKVQTHGWPYIIAWMHRVTGILLVAYLLFHIFTLSYLATPGAYDQKMDLFQMPIFIFFEWALAIPVIFHALNGGRLLAYELLGFRDDLLLLRGVFYLSALYVVSLAIFMIMGTQNVTPFFFWFVTLLLALILSATFFWKKRTFIKEHSIYWILQRITACLLLILIPAHMVFTHLNPQIGHDASTIISRVSSPFIKIVDIVLLLSIVYHSIYGLYSISLDFLYSRKYKLLSLLVSLVVLLIVAYAGTKLTLTL